MPSPDPNARRRWRERVWFARIVRLLVLVVPLVVSFLAAWGLSATLAVPEPFWQRVLRWLGIAIVSTFVLIGLQHALRRLLPLSALLSLTLVFPDEAPSRFRMALRSYSARDLDRALQDAAASGDRSTQEAAEELLVLVAALSRHDRLTRGHSERVRAYSLMIGEEMGLDPDELDRLRWAGLLHDVGKLHVPGEILNKTGRLTDEEFAIIREHTTFGATLTTGLATWLGDDVRAVDQHHERWTGGGYPYGLRGEQITRAARIVSVADAFDVMTSARSYKKPMPAADARAELERCAGAQFDPAVVRAMLSISLGRLWRAMGPLSWVAQLRLFPRQVAQGGTAVATTAATTIAMAVTAIAGAMTGGTSVAAPQLAAAVVVIPATPPATTTVAPTTIAITTTTSTSSTTSTTTTTSTSTTSTTTTTTTPRRAVVPPPSPATTTTTTAATTTTTAATTTTTSSTTTTTTTPPSTTTTTTVEAPAAVELTLASPGAGDVASQPVLDLEPGRPGRNGALPNYDVDRNADPGLTVLRSLQVLEAVDPAQRQVWLFPADVTVLPASVSLRMSVAPAGAAAPGDEIHVRAGIYDCDAGRTGCVRLVRDTPVVPATTGLFVPVTFDLSTASELTLEAGHRLELRVAVVYTSDVDAWIGYDAADHPSTLTLGP